MWVRYYLDGVKIDDEGYYGALSDLDISTILHGLSNGKHELVVEAGCFVEWKYDGVQRNKFLNSLLCCRIM